MATTRCVPDGGVPYVSDPLPELVGGSPPMRQVEALLMRAARSDCLVLLTGETGTGKGLCAELIHRNSARRDKPFVVVDGTLLHDELALSQLFGHVKGAFTGALEARRGMVSEADDGTLFIDEISEASPHVQAALLRLIDEKRFQRLGETHWTPVDCRVVCATRRDLRAMVKAGAFREDLLWRVRCVEVRLPALRERGDDVLLLARFFLDELTRRNGKRFTLEEGTRAELRAHSWPGNVRELKQRLERALALAEGEVISSELLGLPATGIHTPQPHPAQSLEELERRSLLQALQRSGGNRRHAARILGIAESTLRSKLRKHAIDVDTLGTRQTKTKTSGP